MANTPLFQRLEGYKTPRPYDFRQKVMMACTAQGIPQFADPIIHNLGAIILASPHFSDFRFQYVVQERLKRTEGTSCRMALALALYQSGDDTQRKAFVRDGYLPDYESAAKNMRISKLEKQRTIATMLAPQILRIILEDIATEGRG